VYSRESPAAFFFFPSDASIVIKGFLCPFFSYRTSPTPASPRKTLPNPTLFSLLSGSFQGLESPPQLSQQSPSHTRLRCFEVPSSLINNLPHPFPPFSSFPRFGRNDLRERFLSPFDRHGVRPRVPFQDQDACSSPFALS